MSLKNLDLRGTILPKISIDEFEPKAGDTDAVIVVAFYMLDQNPADDLNTFIQRGFIDTVDVEVSPNTDEDGNYLVFVEMERNETFPEKFKALIKDVENVAGKLDWRVVTYLSDEQEFTYNDPAIYKYVITNPEDYVSKEDYMKESVQEKVKSFLQDAHIMYLNFEKNNNIVIGAGSQKIIAEVVDIGKYDTVIGRNFLSESAFRLTNTPIEAKMLTGMLGVYEVMPIDKYICVGHNDTVMLLRNTEIKYRG